MTATDEYYKGKVAVVTGAASGIGLALAETMLSYGASKVVLADFNKDTLDRETARLEKAYPGKTLGVPCDVTKEADVQAMIAKAAASGGERIDLLFNNAGAGFGGNFDKESNEDWAKAFALNFYGALYGVRAVLPIMRKQGGRAHRRHHFRHCIRADAVPDDVQRHEGGAERAFARPPLRIVGRKHPGDFDDAGHGRHRDLSQGPAAAGLRADSGAIRERHPRGGCEE